MQQSYISNLVSEVKNSLHSITEDSPIHDNGNNILSVEVLKFYAILMVILCHVSGPFLYHLNEIDPSSWWTANVYFSFSRHAVPLFVMASGMLLLGQEKSKKLSTFFHRRFLKVVIPFLFWGPVYLLWRFLFKNETMTIVEALKILIEGPVYFHLWFIYLILGLYLVAPILASYLKSAETNNIIYFLCLWFLVVSILPGFRRLFDLKLGIHILVTKGFIGYFILGKVLSVLSIKKQGFKYAYLTIFVMTAVTAVGTYILTTKDDGSLSDFFTRSTSPTIIILSVAIFMLLNSIDYKLLYQKYPFLKQFIQLQSRLSFGIFFIHFIILDILAMDNSIFKISTLNSHPSWSVPLIVLITYILSSVVIFLMQRIPLLNKVVP